MCGVGFRAWGSGLGRGVALRFAGCLQNFSSFSKYVKGLGAGPLRFGSWQQKAVQGLRFREAFGLYVLGLLLGVASRSELSSTGR